MKSNHLCINGNALSPVSRKQYNKDCFTKECLFYKYLKKGTLLLRPGTLLKCLLTKRTNGLCDGFIRTWSVPKSRFQMKCVDLLT